MKTTFTAGILAALSGVGGAVLAQPTLTILGSNSGAFAFQFLPTSVSDDGTRVVGYGGGGWRWGANDIPQFSLLGSSAGGFAIDGYGDRIAQEVPITWNTVANRKCLTWQSGMGTPNVCTPVTGWYGCDFNIVNVGGISGDGTKAFGMIWGDQTCPNPVSPTACCRTTPGIYDIASGTWTLWPKSANTESSKVLSVSRDGTSGVGWDVNVNDRHAAFWDNGILHVLKTGTFQNGQGYAISDNGVWGIGRTTPTAYGFGLWRWKKGWADDATEDLGVPTTPVTGAITPGAISNNGRIIVGSRGVPGGYAWIWRQGIGFQTMDAYLLTLGIDINNYIAFGRVSLATDMSPTGRYITLQGADLGGTYYMMLLDQGPQPCNEADVGGQGGLPVPDYQLDNNDFVVFINLFFAGDAKADVGIQGGTFGHDNQFDNNDFVVFINLFFAGC